MTSLLVAHMGLVYAQQTFERRVQAAFAAPQVNADGTQLDDLGYYDLRIMREGALVPLHSMQIPAPSPNPIDGASVDAQALLNISAGEVVYFEARACDQEEPSNCSDWAMSNKVSIQELDIMSPGLPLTLTITISVSSQ